MTFCQKPDKRLGTVRIVPTAIPPKISKDEASRYLIGDVDSWPSAPEGYVYVIRGKRGGPVKIGFALNPNFRAYELQCGNPDEIAVIAAIGIAGVAALLVERQSHRLAMFAHVRGEWFDLDTLEAVACVLTACQMLDAIPMTHQECGEHTSDIRIIRHVASEEQRREMMRTRLGID